ncbi:MAG: C39 family peptidase [Anaerolineales bacterium]|nr:C39 family peptidase [Anaerolineales bacterium]
MSKRTKTILVALGGSLLLAVLLLQIPVVKSAVSWRYEKFTIYVKNIIDPPGPVPTALPVTPAPPTQTPEVTGTLEVTTPTTTPLPTASVEPLPAQVSLPSPPYEQQTPNNCGPATLSMALHLYSWEGNQEEIADQIKPVLQDRNVNPEEMAYYVRNFAGWLNIQYRVAGDLTILKRLLAARYPVIVESVTGLDPNDALGPSDDLWAAHYLLLTGYDDASQTFTIQDSYHGADLTISYEQLEAEWEPFNNLYMLLYFPQNEVELQSLLGADWDPDANRQRALVEAQAATAANPGNAYAWFNLGSDLVYFERYSEAAQAYDRSRDTGDWPMRMLRYQFGPFLAYFHSNRIDDLLALTDYARGVTEMSEEAWLWYGWALYRQNDFKGAKAAWQKALSINNAPYVDARNALEYVK